MSQSRSLSPNQKRHETDYSIPNSEINTIPELFDAARGISDDKTIIEEIEEEIDEDTPERVTPDDLAHLQV